MKHLVYGLIVTVLFSFCSNEKQYTDTKVKCVIDSVEYHPIGHDNTLQSEPYWGLHLKGYNFKMRSYRPLKKGDTIEIIERKNRK